MFSLLLGNSGDSEDSSVSRPSITFGVPVIALVPNMLGIQVIYAVVVIEVTMTVEYFEEGSYIIFLAGRSMYLFLISSRLAISWVKESRSMTRHLTPSPSSAMMLAVRT